MHLEVYAYKFSLRDERKYVVLEYFDHPLFGNLGKYVFADKDRLYILIANVDGLKSVGYKEFERLGETDLPLDRVFSQDQYVLKRRQLDFLETEVYGIGLVDINHKPLKDVMQDKYTSFCGEIFDFII